MNNTINSSCREISIDEFIRKDLEELVLPQELLTPYTKPIDMNIRRASIMEKIFKNPKQKYDLYVQEVKDRYEEEYNLYEQNETKRINEVEYLTNAHKLQANEVMNTKKELYKNRDIAIVSAHKQEILNQIEYPFEFRKCINTGYCRETKKLVIDYLLPDTQIVPSEK